MFHILIHNSITKKLKAVFRMMTGKVGRFISLEEYACKFPKYLEYVYQRPEQWLTIDGKYDFSRESDAFVVKLKNASCFAFSDVIMLHNGDYFCQIKNDPYIGQSSDCKDNNVLFIDTKFVYDIHIPTNIVEVPSGIFMSGLFSWNYYHYTYQIIPRFGMLEKLAPSIALLVDEKITQIESFSALLNICNIQHRKVILMKKQTRYKVNDLYICSATTILEPNHKPYTMEPTVGVRYSFSALSFLRGTILPHKTTENYPRRIFIGRKYVTSGRRPFNEDECIICAKKYGFEVVYPEKLNFVQQVALFANAECIIGGTGAAFTNLIYVSCGCKVVILSGYQIKGGLWEIIGKYVGAKIYNLYDNSLVLNTNKPHLVHCAYNIEINNLSKILCEITK